MKRITSVVLAGLLLGLQCAAPQIIIITKKKAGGGGETELAADAFNRANENPLASPWVTITGQDNFKLVSNEAAPGTPSSDAGTYRSGISFPADQYVQADIITTATGGGGAGCGIAIRASTSANTFYRIVIDDAASNNVELAKIVGGSYTQLWLRTAAFTSGNTLKVTITGANPGTIKVFVEGSQVGADATDSDIDSGEAGMSYSSNETCTFDNWSAGSIP